MELSKVIGIISYLPDSPTLRSYRKEKLLQLLAQCNKLFNLPIIIIAQNWRPDDYLKNDNYIIYYYNKLGIVGARKKLREKFIHSSYDYLIMLDDDCSISGSPCAIDQYLKEIDEHPDMYGVFNGNLLKLFAISKKIFKRIQYMDYTPEKNEAFEDALFVGMLGYRFPKQKFLFSHKYGLMELSESTDDIHSTWSRSKCNTEMLLNTRRIFYEHCKK